MTTHVLLLLDGSGSMEEVHADALASVNSFMANAKKDAALRDGTFTVVAFSSLGITALRRRSP
jgi:uncharacterized protein YegL